MYDTQIITSVIKKCEIVEMLIFHFMYGIMQRPINNDIIIMVCGYDFTSYHLKQQTILSVSC